MAALGLGLAALGRPGYMTLGHAGDLPSLDQAAMERHALTVLDAAWAAGVRHFDVARSYGRGEQFLARWLTERRPAPGSFTVSSKWGYRYTGGWRADAEVHEVKDHSRAHFESQWAETTAVLGAWVGVYQVHSATLESGVLSDDAVLDALARVRDGGVAVGVSVTGPRQGDVIDTALLVSRGGRRLFDWVQATWNVLEPSAGPALARAHRLGVHTIAKEGLANGRLTARGDVPAWLELAAAAGVAPDALALASSLAQPFLDVVLSGAATVPQLLSNATATRLGAPLPAFEAVVEPPDAYWKRRARLPWT